MENGRDRDEISRISAQDQRTPISTTLSDSRLEIPATSDQAASTRQTIDNPLLTFDDTVARPSTHHTALEEYVLDFARRNKLQDRFELLIFGARLARDKHETMTRYESDITDREKELILNEKNPSTGFWKQSKFFKATIITASFGGVIQGWTQSALNGSINGMPKRFGLCVPSKCTNNTADLWTFGMLNAMPLLSAGIFGTILADPLQENFLGRRGSVMVSCAITVASTIGASVTQNVGQLAACRLINGVALGAKASIVPIYSAELSPEHIRGAILANWQLADAAGIFLGFLANLIIVSYVSDADKSWRILTNTVLIPTIPLLIMIYLMPESPRYFMKHGRYRKALEAFTMIQTTPLLASRDFMYAHAQLDFESRLMRGKADERGNLAARIELSEKDLPSTSVERTREVDSVHLDDGHYQLHSHSNVRLSALERQESDLSSLEMELAARRIGKEENPYFYHIGVTGYFRRLVQLWRNKRCRRALLSASTAMISQQMTGINTIAFLGTIVWENLLDTPSNPRLPAIIGLLFGAANYLGGVPAYWLSDKYGRSVMLAVGLPNMAWSMFVFAFLFKIPESSPARVPLVSILAIVFTLFYAPTAGTSPFSISAEVFPLVSREVGMAVSVAVNFLGAGILVLVFPMLMYRIGATGALSIFAGLNLVAFVLVYLFVPETRRRTLEELQYTFDISTRWHVQYRAQYIRKHFFKNLWKYVTRQEVDPPIPFYRWARITYEPEEEVENS